MLEARNIGGVFASAVEFLAMFDIGQKEKFQAKTLEQNNCDMADTEDCSGKEPVSEILMRR